MYVIGHQTIPMNLQTVLATLLLEQPEVRTPIIVDEEDILPIVTALRSMMRHAWSCENPTQYLLLPSSLRKYTPSALLPWSLLSSDLY
jgi:hypothetical protein